MNGEQPLPSSKERDVFLEALEQPTLEARAAYLDRACGDDSVLRASTEALLQNHRDDKFLEIPPLPLPPVVLTEEPDDQIGRYKLLRVIGEGGCGVVYLAEQEEPIRRRVAIKVIKPGMDSKQVLARFEAERQVLALMDHPNITKVLDAGATEKGRPYVVMELVNGIPITRYCDENMLNTKVRLELFTQVCQAIQHAHQKGVIHRDIKPSNVLVSEQDGVPMPKVIDFGIAKAVSGQRLTDEPIFTALEQFIGTPSYMSPEQAAMSGVDIDTRSDIYSLGVLLYELLTGKTPFDAQELLAAGLDTTRKIIQEQEPPRPSTRLSKMLEAELNITAKHRRSDPSRLMNLISGDLDWIVLKTLDKYRARRYETANGLASDLQRYINNEPVLARPPSRTYRFKKLVRRNKLAFAATVAVTAALVLGLGLSTWLYLKERATNRQVELARQIMAKQRLAAENAEQLAKTEVKLAATYADELKANLASYDFLEAVHLIDQGKKNDALAYLARSLLLNPTNGAALTRLSTLLAYNSWMLPSLTLKHSGAVKSAQFSPDGSRIVTSSDDNTAQIWDAQTGRPVAEPMKHNGRLLSAQFSPDGWRIVTASRDGTARVWDSRTGQPITEPLRHGRLVKSAEFSPDGKKIVTASDDQTARVWSTESGRELTVPLKHNGPVKTARFSPDGTRIVTASFDNTARVWKVENGQPLTEPLKHDAAVWSAEFSLDGKIILTASEDKTARVWDAETGLPLTAPMRNSGGLISARFSRDGKRIVTAGWDGIAHEWDTKSGASLSAPMDHSAAVMLSAQFSPDGRKIVTTSEDGTAKVWDARTGQLLAQPIYHNAGVNSAQFSQDGKWVLTASDDGTAVLWGSRREPLLTEPMQHAGPIRYAEFSPNGQNIVTASDDATARIWDACSAQQLPGPLRHDNGLWLAKFSPNGKLVATASQDGTARVWDVQSGKPVTAPLIHRGWVRSVAFSPDSEKVVTASYDYTARVWDARSGQPLTAPLSHGKEVQSAEFSPNGKWIVTASWDGTARVWNSITGEPRAWRLTNNGGLWSASFSSDGKRIVTATSQNESRVWDAETGIPLTRLMQHFGGVLYSAQFSPDGKQIVTASRDKTARVWNAETGEPVSEPLRHIAAVTIAEFSPDGTKVSTASDDGTARVWDAQSGQPLTDPFIHGAQVHSARFSSDGRKLVTASENRTARLWDILPSTNRCPDWLLQLTEAVSGRVLNQQGVLQHTKQSRVQVLESIKQTLNAVPNDDDWASWGRWYLGDPSHRTISPFSKITVPEYVENRIKDGSLNSLSEAEQLADGNSELLKRIRQAGEVLKEKYVYLGGYFGHTRTDGSRGWIESKSDSDVTFSFDEIKRDDAVIVLKDANRDITIQIPINGGMSKLSTNAGSDWRELYKVQKELSAK